MTISKAQIRKLHVARRQLGLSDDTWRDLLHAEAGVRSSLDLDNAGMTRVLNRLEHDGFVSTASTERRKSRRRRSSAPGEPLSPITQDQQQLLRDLDQELGLAPARSIGFNRHCCGKSWPQTREDASKCIEGRKHVIRRGGFKPTSTGDPQKSKD